jgi:hypothetical protein
MLSAFRSRISLQMRETAGVDLIRCWLPGWLSSGLAPGLHHSVAKMSRPAWAAAAWLNGPGPSSTGPVRHPDGDGLAAHQTWARGHDVVLFELTTLRD